MGLCGIEHLGSRSRPSVQLTGMGLATGDRHRRLCQVRSSYMPCWPVGSSFTLGFTILMCHLLIGALDGYIVQEECKSLRLQYGE